MPYNDNHMKQIYQSMLEPLKEHFFSKELTCMPISIGEKYGQSPIRLMYVGRAVNGWYAEWKAGTTEQLVEQVFEHTQTMSKITKGVVEYKSGDMLCEYNYNRSPFWQLCRTILKQYGIEDGWADYAAWTNLYKVSYSRAGNPKKALIKKTINFCADILFYEILCEQPTHIIFVTDGWWIKPDGRGIYKTAFIDKLGMDTCAESNSGIIVGSGIITNEQLCVPNMPHTKYVITKSPEGAKMTRAQHAKEIIDAFGAIEESHRRTGGY